MKPALVIIDIQNDYFPGGKMELEGGPEASLQAATLLEASRGKGRPLVRAAFVAALGCLYARVRNAAAIAAEISL